jgi:hypothetical protein
MNQALPAPNPQVLFTEIDDGSGVLLHLETKFYYTLNRTGVTVWKALKDGSSLTLSALGDQIAAKFLVDAEAATRDVVRLLEELRADGLVIDRSDAPGPRR